MLQKGTSSGTWTKKDPRGWPMNKLNPVSFLDSWKKKKNCPDFWKKSLFSSCCPFLKGSLVSEKQMGCECYEFLKKFLRSWIQVDSCLPLKALELFKRLQVKRFLISWKVPEHLKSFLKTFWVPEDIPGTTNKASVSWKASWLPEKWFQFTFCCLFLKRVNEEDL